MPPLLTPEDAHRLFQAVVAVGLDASRDTLLVGIDRRFVVGIRRKDRPADQVMEDIGALDTVLADGSVPLDRWLQNAILLAGPRTQADVFRDVLKVVRLGVSNGPNGTAATSETSSRAPAMALESEAAREIRRLSRRALEPVGLPRIPRIVVSRTLLPAVLEALDGRRPSRVISVVGAAGFGKTTLLGELHDHLAERCVDVLIVNCHAIKPTDLDGHESLDLGFGRIAVGRPVSVRDFACAQRGGGRRCVLLVDTIDLVVSRASLGALAGLFARLAERGVVTVFTCREFEYGEYFERRSDDVRLIVGQLDKHVVPLFTDAEVRAAAAAFLRSQTLDAGDRRCEAFSDRLLALCADQRSLRGIVHNPLLLSMLCEVFGDRVPEDLTVSDLYSAYWRMKVSGSRAYDRPLERAKEVGCYRLAAASFDPDEDYLRESVSEQDMLALGELNPSPVADLLSESVWQRTPADGIRFFHQTLLEFAIARWLMTSQGALPRARLIDRLTGPDGVRATHLWPVIRQYIALCDPGDYRRLRDELPMGDLIAFRALAFGTVSRRYHGADESLRSLTAAAEVRGGDHQAVLAEALDAAPDRLAEAVWEAALSLLRSAPAYAADRAAELAGDLLARGRIDGHQIDNALAAVKQNNAVPEPGALIGQLLRPICERAALRYLEPLGVSLRARYQEFGDGARSKVVAVHTGAHVPDADCLELWTLVANNLHLLPDTAAMMPSFVARVLDTDTPPFNLWDGTSVPWWPGLDRKDDRRTWRGVFNRVAGQRAARDPQALNELLAALLTENASVGLVEPGKALAVAVRAGGGARLLDALAARPDSPLDGPNAERFVGIFKNLAESDAQHVERVVDALAPAFERAPIEFAVPMAMCAVHSSSARKALIAHFPQLPLGQLAPVFRANVGLLRELAPRVASVIGVLAENEPIHFLDLRLQLALALGDTAGEAAAIARLVDRAGKPSRDEALAAAGLLRRQIDKLTALHLAMILPVVSAREPGSRVHILEAMRRRDAARADLNAADIVEISNRLRDETEATVLIALGRLLSDWMNRRDGVDEPLARTVMALARRVAAPGAEPGVCREVLRALKFVAQRTTMLSDTHIQILEQFVREVDFGRLSDGEAEGVDLLSAANASEFALLSRLAKTLSQLPEKNGRAVVFAGARLYGWASSFMDGILADGTIPKRLRDLIEERRSGQRPAAR